MLALGLLLVFFSYTTYAETVDFNYNEIFENHKLVRLIIDVETGALIKVNEAAVAYYGYTRDELLKMNIAEINTLSPEETRNEWEAAAKEERNFFNFRHKLASGEIRDVEVHSYPFDHQGESYLYSIVVDKTEAVAVAKQLERNRIKMFFFAFVAIEHGTSLVDIFC
jgi:PAS domain S-box-containing protein